MYQIIAKAINTTTKVVLYEGVKAEYESYQQAARVLKQIVLHPKDIFQAESTSHRVPNKYIKNIHAYVSWNHCGSSIRTTLYIKRVEFH